MKKKGFTLIELLAVIVILAIIALIATPIVMNVIENSRKGAAERSAENYIDAVETAIATERLDGEVLEGEYTINSDGNLVKDGKTINIDMSGNKPKSGTIYIENGQVVDKLSTDATKATVIKTKDDYTVNYNSDGKLEASKNENSGSNSVTVYRFSNQEVKIGDNINDFEYVENSSELGKDYYLKHEVENNLVTATYICLNEELCVRTGTDETGNSYYNENKEKLKILNSCYFGEGITMCSYNSIELNFSPDGYMKISSHAGSRGCDIIEGNISYCWDRV